MRATVSHGHPLQDMGAAACDTNTGSAKSDEHPRRYDNEQISIVFHNKNID